MKKFFFILLLLNGAVQAQHITDAKLLGTWKLKAMQLGEIYADFDKDSLSYDENWVNSAENAREKQTRQLVIQGLKDAVVQTRGFITFRKDNTYMFTMLPEVIERIEKYNLIYDGKNNYIITGKNKEKIGLKITGRLLYWQVTEEGQAMDLIFEKNK